MHKIEVKVNCILEGIIKKLVKDYIKNENYEKYDYKEEKYKIII